MDGKEKSVTNENILAPTRSAEPYLTHFNRPVVEQAIFLTANETLEEAMEKVDEGNYPGAFRLLERNREYLKANSVYMNTYPLLHFIDSVNAGYSLKVERMKTMHPDSLKKLQKSSKDVNYRLRNKKI
jgi:hypothetical protein